MGDSVATTLEHLYQSRRLSGTQWTYLSNLCLTVEDATRQDDGVSLPEGDNNNRKLTTALNRVLETDNGDDAKSVSQAHTTTSSSTNNILLKLQEQVDIYLTSEVKHGRLDPATRNYINSLLQLDLRGPFTRRRNDGVKSRSSTAGTTMISPRQQQQQRNGIVTKLGQLEPYDDTASGNNSEFALGFALYNGIWGYSTRTTQPAAAREFALLGHSSGFYIIDVTIPTRPVQVQFIPLEGGDIWRDVETHTDPRTGTTYAYVAAQNFGNLTIVNLDCLSILPVDPFTETVVPNSANCEYVDRGQTDFGHTLSVRAGYLFLNTARARQGCRVYDLLDDPWNPRPLAPYLGDLQDCHDSDLHVNVQVPGFSDPLDLLYVSDGFSGVVHIVDMTGLRDIDDDNNSTIPYVILGEADLNAALPANNNNTTDETRRYAHSSALSTDGRHLFACDELNVRDITVFDVSNPADPQLVTTFGYVNDDDDTQDAIVHNVKVKGNLLLVAYYEAGFRVFDITDCTKPVEVGMFNTYLDPNGDGIPEREIIPFAPRIDGAWNVYTELPSGTILVSDIRGGLFTFAVNETAIGDLPDIDDEDPNNMDDLMPTASPSLRIPQFTPPPFNIFPIPPGASTVSPLGTPSAAPFPQDTMSPPHSSDEGQPIDDGSLVPIQTNNEERSNAPIIGGAVGGTLFVLALAVALMVICRRRREKTPTVPSPSVAESAAAADLASAAAPKQRTRVLVTVETHDSASDSDFSV